jgi:hypothetical protein
MKTHSKNFCLATALAFAVALALCLLFLWQMPADVAYAMEDTLPESEISVGNEPVLLINGEEQTQQFNLSRGDGVTFAVRYGDVIYTPELFADDAIAAFSIDGNVFTLNKNSRLGEIPITVYCEFDDGNVYEDTFTVNAVLAASQEIISTDIDESNKTIVSLADDVAYVNATATMQDYRGSVDLTLSDNSVLNDELSMAPHGTSGLTLDYSSATLETENNLGETSLQTVENNTSNLLLAQVASTSLLGSGTSRSPYRITCYEDFLAMPDYVSTSSFVYFRQTASFTISDTSTPFNEQNFYGCYNGYNNTIYVTNLTNKYSAFCRENHGTIENINFNITYLKLTKLFSVVGVVCAKNYGYIYNITVSRPTSYFIYNCFNEVDDDGTISYQIEASPFQGLGVIAGENEQSCSISNCHVSISVSSMVSYGGIAENNLGTIVNCSALSYVLCETITVFASLGGIVNFNQSTGNVTVDEMVGSSLIINYVSCNANSNPVIGSIIGSNHNTSLSADFDVPQCLMFVRANSNDYEHIPTDMTNVNSPIGKVYN